MKNYYLILLSIIIFLSFFSGCIENKQTSLTTLTPERTPLQKQYNNMTHEQFTQAVEPPSGLTQLQMQDFYNSLDRLSSQYVTWRLQVEDVTPNSVQLRVGSSSIDEKKQLYYM